MKTLTGHSPTGILAPLTGGVVIGLFTTVMVSTFPWTFTVLVFLGLLVLVPVGVLPDSSLYWLTLYLIGLPLEIGKRITNLSYDSEQIVTTLGLPPFGDLGVKLYPTDLALLALVLPWIFALATRRERLYFPRIGFALLGYLLWASLSSILKADYLSLSVAEVVQQWKYFVVYLYVCNRIRTPRAVRVILVVLTAALLIEAGATVAFDVLGQTRESLLAATNLSVTREFEFAVALEEGSQQKATGTFGSASHLAMYLQLLFGVALTLTFMANAAWQRWLSFALFGLGAIAIYLTTSRSAAIGFGMGMIACIALLRRTGVLSTRHLAAILYVSIVLGAAGGAYIYAFMVSRPETFSNRFGLLREGALLVAENPMLGVGPNNGTAARLDLANRLGYQQRQSVSDMPTYDHFYPVHNHFIVVASETGVVGLLLYLTFFGGITREALRRSRSPHRPVAILSIAVVSGYVALASQLLGDHFVGNATHSLVFLYAGLITAFARVDALPPGNT